ncbi:CAP domain-containing protein [Mucilaginibacter aquatilis]|uniref:CAP domain-containing protein n=1 Tax=Mucilaginibacter aquatilis TaxID=1517760 RepID=A0A6I4IC03_9SPHI|nr:CAP domain-containing protein [Mucilaginibacter aquatilis]MVN92741.1 CAP domain-containing protein [Mucilaginibacter aquatilis]
MGRFWINLFLTLIVSSLFTPSQAQTASSKFKNEFLTRINKIRKQGCKCGTTNMPPVAPLVWNDELAAAAAGHARDMARNTYFSHNSRDGRSIESRITNAGYTYDGYKSFAIGENIAQGQTSIAEVNEGWFKSPRHCMNLMNRDFTEIGVAENNTYWVQDFGGREAFTNREKELIKSGRIKIRRVK